MQPFTPAEIADLRIIGARAAMDRGDIAPMRYVTFQAIEDEMTMQVERVIPWLEALNLEVG